MFSFKEIELQITKNADYPLTLTHCINVLQGFQSLNDISSHLNAAVTFKVVLFSGQMVLLAIYAVFGFFKYYTIAFQYLKLHFYMAATLHGLVAFQCFLNSSSAGHVRFSFHGPDLITNAFFRLKKCFP